MRMFIWFILVHILPSLVAEESYFATLVIVVVGLVNSPVYWLETLIDWDFGKYGCRLYLSWSKLCGVKKILFFCSLIFWLCLCMRPQPISERNEIHNRTFMCVTCYSMFGTGQLWISYGCSQILSFICITHLFIYLIFGSFNHKRGMIF